MASGEWVNHKYIDKIEKAGKKIYIYKDSKNTGENNKESDTDNKDNKKTNYEYNPSLVSWARKPTEVKKANEPKNILEAGADWLRRNVLGYGGIDFKWD